MIFDAELAAARARRDYLAGRLQDSTKARAKLVERIEKYTRYAAAFEAGVAQARALDQFETVPLFRTYWWNRSTWIEFCEIDHRNRKWVQRERERWTAVLARLTHLRDQLDRRIRVLEERKFRVEYWLLEKDETWGKLDRETLRGQIRSILVAADELSQLIVGRKVPIAFDTRDDAPLGYVPVHKTKDAGRKVYLSARILGDQPEHLLDYYQALLVHELGHLLLHLKESGREYRKLRRLMRERITRAPHFFDVFNILLDEQLERILRDTKPEWQRWFNRLDFYARRIPLQELTDTLAKAGRTIEEFTERKLVKVYADPRQPFAAIQSAEVFSENLGFTRLYAFYATLRHRLPHATVRELWLQQCLDLIPKDFKTLDLFGVHALAVEVYKILMEGTPGLRFVKVKIERSGVAGVTEIELPGEWCVASERGVVVLRAPKRSRKRGTTPESASLPPPPFAAQPDPEGGPAPPPPPPPPPPPMPVPRVRFPGGGARPVHVRVSQNPYKGPSPGTKPGWMTGPTLPGRSKRKSSRKAKPSWSPKVVRSTQPQRPEPPRPRPPRTVREDNTGLEAAEQLAATEAPPPTAVKRVGPNRVLDQLVKEVRAELDGPPSQPTEIDRITPDAVQAVDRRNESPDVTFPPPEQTLTLLPDRTANRLLAQSVRPLVNILRPYFTVADPTRIWEERLTGGRRVLGSALTKHLAYGEPRLFADPRLLDADQHAEVLVAVLIDTSSSMGTDGRLDRAKRVAALLAECLRECPQVESVFLGFNQNVYRCGTHDEYSLGSLAPAGKTNEAAALDFLDTHYLDVPRRRKAVIVLSDGLPTACSVESVGRVVRRLETERGVRCVHGAMSDVAHPAYRRRVDLIGELQVGTVREFGRSIAELLR